MGTIKLENIRLFAYHGCLDEEGLIGSEYAVDLEVEADLQQASETDRLSDTVDYVLLHQLVVEEMKQRSKLLEHVAKRILNRLFEESSLARSARISVSKVNPPIGGDVARVSVVLTQKRS